MQFIVITGLSGAGKSIATNALEDLGVYCVDNLPPMLIPQMAQLCLDEKSPIENLALGIDTRSGAFFGHTDEALDALKSYQAPDETFDWEKRLLEALCCMALAEQAIGEGRLPYAETLLALAEQAGAGTPYFLRENRQALLSLKARIRPELAKIICVDVALLQKAEGETEPARAAALLDAMEEQGSSRWCLLRGRAAANMGEYARAEVWLKQAEKDFSGEALPLLEGSLRGFADADAVLTAPETRSSSPVRILRDESRQSKLKGLYPCGEGAGYAGGITSAAVDGMRCAEQICRIIQEESAV